MSSEPKHLHINQGTVAESCSPSIREWIQEDSWGLLVNELVRFMSSRFSVRPCLKDSVKNDCRRHRPHKCAPTHINTSAHIMCVPAHTHAHKHTHISTVVVNFTFLKTNSYTVDKHMRINVIRNYTVVLLKKLNEVYPMIQSSHFWYIQKKWNQHMKETPMFRTTQQRYCMSTDLLLDKEKCSLCT